LERLRQVTSHRPKDGAKTLNQSNGQLFSVLFDRKQTSGRRIKKICGPGVLIEKQQG